MLYSLAGCVGIRRNVTELHVKTGCTSVNFLTSQNCSGKNRLGTSRRKSRFKVCYVYSVPDLLEKLSSSHTSPTNSWSCAAKKNLSMKIPQCTRPNNSYVSYVSLSSIMPIMPKTFTPCGDVVSGDDSKHDTGKYPSGLSNDPPSLPP